MNIIFIYKDIKYLQLLANIDQYKWFEGTLCRENESQNFSFTFSHANYTIL